MQEIINCYVDFFRNYTNFSGRSRRKAYWYVMLVNFIIGLIFGVLTNILGFFSILSGIYSLATLVPGIALALRRLHDIGKSGWWILIGLIPLVGEILLIIWFCQDSQPGSNQYGPNPKGM